MPHDPTMPTPEGDSDAGSSSPTPTPVDISQSASAPSGSPASRSPHGSSSNIAPQGRSSNEPAKRYLPFASPNHTVTKGRYITSNDPRGYIPVHEYPLNGQWIMMDIDDGYILWTGIWKALGNSKADIVKMIDSQPELASSIRRVRGGYLKIQGTWMPYETTLCLARRVAWPIRYDLIPLFGPTFPHTCLSPDQPGYGQVVASAHGRRRRRFPPLPRPRWDAQFPLESWTLRTREACDSRIPPQGREGIAVKPEGWDRLPSAEWSPHHLRKSSYDLGLDARRDHARAMEWQSPLPVDDAQPRYGAHGEVLAGHSRDRQLADLRSGHGLHYPLRASPEWRERPFTPVNRDALSHRGEMPLPPLSFDALQHQLSAPPSRGDYSPPSSSAQPYGRPSGSPGSLSARRGSRHSPESRFSPYPLPRMASSPSRDLPPLDRHEPIFYSRAPPELRQYTVDSARGLSTTSYSRRDPSPPDHHYGSGLPAEVPPPIGQSDDLSPLAANNGYFNRDINLDRNIYVSERRSLPSILQYPPELALPSLRGGSGGVTLPPITTLTGLETDARAVLHRLTADRPSLMTSHHRSFSLPPRHAGNLPDHYVASHSSDPSEPPSSRDSTSPSCLSPVTPESAIFSPAASSRPPAASGSPAYSSTHTSLPAPKLFVADPDSNDRTLPPLFPPNRQG